MKALYERYVLPHLVHVACGMPSIRRRRESLVREARGVVLDVGMGSGHNLALLQPQAVRHVYGLEPTAEMVRRARPAVEASPVPAEVIPAGAESIPLASDAVDTILLTYTGCTIPGIQEAMAEMRRVLRPGGRLLFLEHGRSPDPAVARWQDLLDRPWGLFAGGCHLNRDMPALLSDGGFDLEWSEASSMRGIPRCFSYTTRGSARPR